MTVGNFNDLSNLKVKLSFGASFVKVRPIFTFDSKCIILAHGNDVKLYNIQSGECVHTLKYHTTSVVSLCENKNNQLQFFSCSEDGCVVRWDSTEGKVLEVIDLHEKLFNVFIPDSSDNLYLTKKTNDEIGLYSVKAQICNRVLARVGPSEHSIAFGCEGQYVAAVYDNEMSVYEFKTRTYNKHLMSSKFTCVTCHPSDYLIATGDNRGKILVWTNFFNTNRPIKSIYHWHSLPVSDLAFSSEGSFLYSGGGEAVLVKWNLFSNERSFLPRLGAPIQKLTLSPDNAHVVVAQSDNTLQIINSQSKIVQVIQGLTKSYFHGAKQINIMPTGLLYDQQTKSLVMNGKPGHLQFYNIDEEKHLFNLDISGRNFISQEKSRVVVNTDVQKAAIDEKGHWLATAEYWYDEETSPQIWLKFWEFNLTKQIFVLNTNVILPHNKEINYIVFQPNKDSTGLPCAITTSKDARFKTWMLEESSDDKQNWVCTAIGCYRDLPAGSSCFSEDGSLLAVAFGNIGTLWTAENASLKAALYHEKINNNIRQLVFGRKTCSPLLVCHDGESIIVWNVVSLSISWIVHTQVQTIAVDPMSDILAAFCEDQTLIMFKPNNPEPVCSIENVSNHHVISAIFVPNNKKVIDEGDCFYNKSHLFFLDEDQNLFTLIKECESNENLTEMITLKQNIPLTPYGMLQPELKISNVSVTVPELLPLDTVTNKKDIQITCPRLIDPISLCTKTLQSLLIPATKLEPETVISVNEDEKESHINKPPKKSLIKVNEITDFSFLINNVKFSC